jgi:hypothetical protein
LLETIELAIEKGNIHTILGRKIENKINAEGTKMRGPY